MLALFCKPVIVIEPTKMKPIMTPQDCRIVQVKEIKDNAFAAEFLEPLDWVQAPPIVIPEKMDLTD